MKAHSTILCGFLCLAMLELAVADTFTNTESREVLKGELLGKAAKGGAEMLVVKTDDGERRLLPVDKWIVQRDEKPAKTGPDVAPKAKEDPKPSSPNPSKTQPQPPGKADAPKGTPEPDPLGFAGTWEEDWPGCPILHDFSLVTYRKGQYSVQITSHMTPYRVNNVRCVGDTLMFAVNRGIGKVPGKPGTGQDEYQVQVRDANTLAAQVRRGENTVTGIVWRRCAVGEFPSAASIGLMVFVLTVPRVGNQLDALKALLTLRLEITGAVDRVAAAQVGSKAIVQLAHVVAERKGSAKVEDRVVSDNALWALDCFCGHDSRNASRVGQALRDGCNPWVAETVMAALSGYWDRIERERNRRR